MPDAYAKVPAAALCRHDAAHGLLVAGLHLSAAMHDDHDWLENRTVSEHANGRLKRAASRANTVAVKLIADATYPFHGHPVPDEPNGPLVSAAVTISNTTLVEATEGFDWSTVGPAFGAAYREIIHLRGAHPALVQVDDRPFEWAWEPVWRRHVHQWAQIQTFGIRAAFELQSDEGRREKINLMGVTRAARPSLHYLKASCEQSARRFARTAITDRAVARSLQDARKWSVDLYHLSLDFEFADGPILPTRPVAKLGEFVAFAEQLRQCCIRREAEERAGAVHGERVPAAQAPPADEPFFSGDHYKSKFGLTPKRLLDAKSARRLPRSVKVGGRWQYHFEDVRAAFPDEIRDQPA